MNCKKCGKEIDGTFGSGVFCSKHCSNSREFDAESRRKKSEANIRRYIEKGSWGGLLPNLTEEQRKAIGLKRRAYCNKVLLEDNFSELSYERKIKRVRLEQGGKCFECGLNEWRGKKLTLEIEHRNGNHNDNTRDNLIAICPNCHSITSTWRGRNKHRDTRWLSGPEIYDLYKSGKNIRQLLIHMGFAAKGANYSKIRRVIERYEENIVS